MNKRGRMTFAQELLSLAEAALDVDESTAVALAGRIRAMATKCTGHVLVKPTVTELSWGCQASVDDNFSEHVGEGDTPTEALSDLQRRLGEVCVRTDDPTD